jgi:hypothetical protein
MSKKGWMGSSNPFIISMERGIQNAVNIVVYHLTRLFLHKGEGAWQLSMYEDFRPEAEQFIAAAGARTGDLSTQVEFTDIYESEFKDMSTKLDSFDDLVRKIHNKNSIPYRAIWGATRNRFYDGTYEQRVGALTALKTEMAAQGVDDGATAVEAYLTEIDDRHKAQQERMVKVGSDGSVINELRPILINKLNKDRGGLISQFAMLVDYQDKVNHYFPLNLLGDRSVWGHYQLIIPKGDFRRICIHTFKDGEKIEITAMDADAWISTADNADHPITSGYKIAAGTTVIIDPALLGDLSKKFIIATNVNLETSCDLIFNILKG